MMGDKSKEKSNIYFSHYTTKYTCKCYVTEAIISIGVKATNGTKSDNRRIMTAFNRLERSFCFFFFCGGTSGVMTEEKANKNE